MKRTSSAMRFIRTGAPVLALAVSAVTSLTAQAQAGRDAQPSEQAVQLQPIKVEDSGATETATGPVDGYAAARSATGTKTDTPIKEIPQSISVISAGQIRDQNAQTLQEALGYSAGVRAATYGVDNRGDWFTLRGSSESSVLLDGLRLPLSGWYGSVRNEPFAFERIEVLRGPSSIVAGQNAPGGVVNMVSKLPLAEARRLVSLQLGNFDHKQIALDSTGPFTDGGNLLYRVVALAKDSGTQIDHATDERQYISPSLTWLAGDKSILTVYAQYQKDESMNTNAFLPWAGTLYPAPNGYIDDALFIGEPDWDSYGGERLRLGYQFEYLINDNWSIRHNLRHDDLEGHLASMYANFWEVDAAGNGYVDATGTPATNGEYLNRTWYITRTDSKVLNTDLLLEGKLNAGTVEHTLLLGIDAMRFEDNQRTADGAATPLNVFDPVYGGFPKPSVALGAGTPLETDQTGFMLQDQARFDDRWIVVAGLRRDHVTVGIEGAANDDIDDTVTTRRLGLVYLAGNGWAPYLSYSESFETISGFDSNGNLFEPKQGEQVEAGVKWSPDNGAITATAAVYSLKETNRPVFDIDDPDSTDAFSQIQAGEVEVDGIELDVSADLQSWSLLASYTYTDAKIVKGDPGDPSVGKQLSSIPERSASLWAVHTFSNHSLQAGGGVRYVGETWDGTDLIRTPANTVFDTMIAYDLGAWRYALNVNNLFDEEYIAICLTRGDCWFGTRREIVASANYHF